MRRMLVLGGAAAAAYAGWRMWSTRRAESEPITFDWEVPPPVDPPPPAPSSAFEEPRREPAGGEGAATPVDRERESQTEAETKFEQLGDAERAERSRAAEQLAADPLPEPEEPTP